MPGIAELALGIIMAAGKELPVAEAHLAKAQAILRGAFLPERVFVIPAPNEFNKLSTGRRLSKLFLESGSMTFLGYIDKM
jgi:hypothetical protein